MKKSPLRRKTKLVARTALESHSTLKSTKALVTKTRLRPRSKKMEAIYEERRPFVKEFLEQHPKCQAHWDDNCFEWAKDVHEILPRSAGGSIVGGDPDNYMAVCRYCHSMIDLYPEEAHRRGLRKWSWERQD